MLYPVSAVRRLVESLDHPECVAVASDGTVYAGGEAGQVYRISQDGRNVEEFANTGGFCLGLALDRDENIYVCDLRKRALLKVTQQGAVSLVAESVDGVKIRTPNFGVFDAQGNLYFSDSGEWKQANGVVWRLSHRGKVELFAAGPFHFANGLALDAQECYLYVVESNRDRVVRIEIKGDGSAGSLEVFAERLARVPDGMAFDSTGNLYVTTYASNCIYRVSTAGHVELFCQDVENLLLCQPTNCAFGGPNFDQLYVSNLGRDHIAVLDLKVKGQELWTHRDRR
jgi:gluconolactonase